MSDKISTTESHPPESRWLDRLGDAEALAVMAEDQIQAASAVSESLDEIAAAASALAHRLKTDPSSVLFYAGAGTSARIAVQDGVELPPTFDWPEARLGFIIAGGTEALMTSVENAEDDTAQAAQEINARMSQNDILIGIAASGATPFTCQAIKTAALKGCLTIGIANNINAPITSLAEYGITLKTGTESLAGSTRMKAGTAQKICLNLISTLAMTRLGRVKNGVMVALRPANAKLRERQKNIDALLKR